jgi:acetyl-CoA acyltransferase
MFQEQILPIEVEVVSVDGTKKFMHSKDEGIRPGSTPEGLAKLRPVFKQGGTVTAANASQMSDAAAGVIIMSRAKAEELGLKPMARFLGYSVGGVRPEVMGIGPIVAVPKVLKQVGLSLDEIDLIELNEAFASQALVVIRELGLNKEIVNVNGGAIALGHPLGCTGTKLSVQLLYEMARRKSKFGLVTMCIGGGMGAAGIYENLMN